MLGPLTVIGQDGEIRINSQTQRSILAYLTVHAGRVVTPEQILEAVWENDVPSGGRSTLAYHMSKLRETITKQGGDASAIKTISGGYSLQIGVDDLDSALFEMLHERAREAMQSDPDHAAEIAAHSLELWSDSEPYSDLRYESFLQTEIQRLLEKKMKSSEILLRGKLNSGSTQPVIETLPALLEEAPYNESLHGLYMEALAEAGRRTEAIRHYDSYLEMLADETGNTPQAGLQELAARLVADERPRQVLRGSNLPASITPLIGRQGDLQQLMVLMEQHRYVDVLGPGGVGKSRLATEAVRNVADYEDAIGWFIDLTRSHDSVTGAVADVLGLKDRPDEDLRDVICQAVGDTEAIFLFDNCEALVDEISSIAKDLLSNCPKTRVVTTSRFVTDELSAAVFRLEPMGSDSLSDDGPRLFLERASAMGVHLDTAAQATAISIVKGLEGMPLAIELAASQLDTRSIDDLHASLIGGGVQAFDKSLALSGEGPLWQILRASFELLGDDDRRYLRHISAISGAFDSSDLADLLGVPTRKAEAALQRLSRRSLVVPKPGFTPTRYMVLDTVREFVANLNSTDGWADEVLEKHTHWCEELTRRCRRQILNDSEVLLFMADRLGNIRSAVDRLEQARDADRLARLVSRIDLFWVISGRAAEGLRHLKRAMALDAMSPDVEALAYSSAGLLASIDRSYDRAESWFAHALQLGEHAPQIVPLVFANRARSRTAQAFSGKARDSGKTLERAGKDFNAALTFFEAADLAAGLAITLPFAGWHAILIEEPQRAESHCERAMTIGENHGYGWPVAVARAIRGLLGLTTSRPADAASDLEVAGSGFEVWRDRYSLQITESLRAAAYMHLEDIETATGAIIHALTVMESQGSREWEAMTAGIALEVLQHVGAPAPIRSSCYWWLEANHAGWHELLDTVGLAISSEDPADGPVDTIPASRMARECRMALEASGFGS